MTPITDDLVRALIDRLESDQIPVEEVASSGPTDDGGPTARILQFHVSPQRGTSAKPGSAALHDLAEARATRNRARTEAGVFHYVPRL